MQQQGRLEPENADEIEILGPLKHRPPRRKDADRTRAARACPRATSRSSVGSAPPAAPAAPAARRCPPSAGPSSSGRNRAACTTARQAVSGRNDGRRDGSRGDGPPVDRHHRGRRCTRRVPDGGCTEAIHVLDRDFGHTNDVDLPLSGTRIDCLRLRCSAVLDRALHHVGPVESENFHADPAMNRVLFFLR